MNLKVTKRMISILCALTISTSSIVTSVGAIKAYPGIVVNAEPSANLKNAVDKLNNTLKLSTDTIKTSIENIRELSESKKDDNNVLDKLKTVISKLDNVIVIINSWNELSIQNVELADNTQKIITELNLNVLLDETKDINQLASLEKNSNKIFSEIEKVNSQLANENRRLLSDEVRSKASKFKEQVDKFRDWKLKNHIITKEEDSTADRRQEAIQCLNSLSNKFDNLEAKRYIELVEQVSKEMIDFQNRFNLRKKYDEFNKKVKEFRVWKDNNHIDKNDDTSVYSRNKAIKYLHEIKQNLDGSKVEQFIKLTEQASKEMIDFQNSFNLNKLNKKYDEFNKKVNEFLTWKGHNNINEIDDATVHSRNEALKYFNDIKQNLDDSKVEQFIKLTEKASKEMIDFQNSFNLNKLNKKYDEFNKKVNEFLTWKGANNIDEIDDITCYSRQEAIKYFDEIKNDIKNDVDDSKLEQFIKLTEQASKEMADFQNEFNSVVNDNNQDQLNKLNFRSKLVAKEEEYNQRYNEFQTWKENGHAGINYDEIKELNHEIIEQVNNVTEQFRTLEYETARKLIEMMDQAIIKMEELKNKNGKPELKRQLGKIQTELTEELHKEKTSNQLVKQKVDEIVKILEDPQFDDYNENLDIILPIIDSLHINQQKKILKKAGEKTVEEYRNFTDEEIQTNQEARVKFMHILSKSIASHVDKTINSLYSNDMTKPVAEYIKNRKDGRDGVVDYYTKMILCSTAYLQYISARKALEPIDNTLNKLQNEYMKSIDKNQVKDLYGFYFNQFLDKISDTEHLYSNYQEPKKDFAEFDMLFRNYAKQITRMRSDEEKIYIEQGGRVFVRTVDHLASIREKYKSLDSLYNEMSYAIQARIQLYMDSIDHPENRKADEDELKTAIDNARKAFDKFQKCVVLVDNQEFFIIED